MNDTLNINFKKYLYDRIFLLLEAPLSKLSHELMAKNYYTSKSLIDKSQFIQNEGYVDSLQSIINQEGLLSLWETLPMRFITAHLSYVRLYQLPKPLFLVENTALEIPAEAIFNGIKWSLISLIEYPFTVMNVNYSSQRFSNNDTSKHKNIFDIFRHIHKNEGLKGFYRGFGAEIAFNFIASFFFTYMNHLSQKGRFENKTKATIGIFSLFLVFIGISIPFETAICRVQLSIGNNEHQKSFIEIIKDLYERDGFKGFYQFLPLRLLILLLNI